MQPKKTKEQTGITGLYCRLSRDDGTEGDSNSIANQRKLLQKYAKENGFSNTRYYVDDGYTGTNFNRPGFQKMQDDIEMGYVSTVIVKDMSRLGRDYLTVGYYTDNYFPDHNIRFIAINDCVDSNDGENELAPFRNVMNEMYARDISRKVRSSNRLRGNSGEPLSQPPYGYLKSPENKKKWIIDPATAPIVREIFQMALEGKGNETIAAILHKRRIQTPMEYWRSIGKPRGGRIPQAEPCKWNMASIGKILHEQQYCGDVINFKTYSKNFKQKTRLKNKPENWVVFRDVHEPIIDRDVFEQVQQRIGKTKRRAPKPENGEKNMFADMLFCADCGSKLWFHVNTISHIPFFACSNYKSDYRGTCKSRHYVRADSLEEVVKLELRRLTAFLTYDEDSFAGMLEEKTNRDAINNRKQLEAELQKAICRNEEVARLYERLYEDNVSGKVTDEWVAQLSHKYELERLNLKEKISQLHQSLAEAATAQQNQQRFTAAVRKFMEMKYLTPTMLHELIDHIVIHETEGSGKNRSQRIEIYYRFVGYLDTPWEGSTYCEHIRQGVEQEFITKVKTAG